MAIKYKNKEFFKEYINPISWVTQFSPLVSISFRLFGNIISGTIVLGLLYGLTNTLWSYIPVLGQINALGGLLLPPFHFYFDLFQGILQSYIFAVLTVSYWGTIANVEHVPKKKKTVAKEETIVSENKIELNRTS